MSRALRRAAWAAVPLLAAGGALGYVRGTTSKGRCLYWASRQVTYAVNDFSVNGASQVCGAPPPAAVLSAVQASFTTWTQATLTGSSAPCTDLVLVSQGTTPSTNTGLDGMNLVVWRRGRCSDVVPPGNPCIAAGNCADAQNCWDTAEPQHASDAIVALTTATYDTRTGEIVDADLELNAWNGSGPSPPGYYFTCVNPGPGVPTCGAPGQTGCISMDVQNTVTHEAGHVLGLGHTTVAGATMAATAFNGETAKRTLEQDDVQGICAIYPAGAPVVTCGSVAQGGCGCGAGGADGWLGLAGLWWLRRRRRRQAVER